ncbi:MAG: hypothetical protein GDA43_23655 [Hormoscilla sp. SP5CHS1]|nr:hypothetical protein [Hormoscilla sp. SP12CHS1]MBC6455808.1 hypothetical protein [Hormoscilla sp. SP5CHS1]
MTGPELQIFTESGDRFLTYLEMRQELQELELQRAERERQRAERERQRAELERQRAEQAGSEN